MRRDRRRLAGEVTTRQLEAGYQPASELRDEWWERLLWPLMARVGHVAGIPAARAAAALIIRATARSKRGYLKGVYRVAAPHVRPQAPHLHKLPEEWWQRQPTVNVRRLGIDFDLDLRDNLQRCLYFTGSYEPQVIGLLRQHLRRGDVFVDVGGHIGVHSLYVARHFQRIGGGRVYTFEPTADSAARIRATAAANGLEVTVVQAALGTRAGTVQLFSDDRYDIADAGVRSQFGNGRVVATAPVLRFDSWVEEVKLERLDAVKMDVEGAEPLAIEGMLESLARLQPKLLVVETRYVSPDRAGIKPAQLRDQLISIGYRPIGVALFRNEVFVRERPAAS